MIKLGVPLGIMIPGGIDSIAQLLTALITGFSFRFLAYVKYPPEYQIMHIIISKQIK